MINYINEEQGAQTWKKLLVENFDVKDPQKADWISRYASVHEIFEANLGINGVQSVNVQTNGVSPLYATPLNTIGMGNPAAPQNPNPNTTFAGAAGNFHNQTPGSGDVPVSTLPMALNVALMTVGLELVPVIPSKGPWSMLTYMDFPYAGGKLGRINETAFDGKGKGAENKPIYIKVVGTLAELAAYGKALKEANKTAKQAKTALVVTVAGEDATFTGTFLGIGRNDGGILLKTISCTKTTKSSGVTEYENVYPDGDACVGVYEEAVGDGRRLADKAEAVPAAITEVFAARKVTITADNGFVAPDGVTALTNANADFVQTSADFVDGFANFTTGEKRPMTRAENETGTGNVIGLRLFSKWVQMGSYEVTGTVTRQQLQDLPLYGINAVSKVMEAMQNELTQHINARILDRVFALGVTNAAQQKAFQGVDLNLYLDMKVDANGESKCDLCDFTMAKYEDIYGHDYMLKKGWEVQNSEALTSAENTHTRQRRISSRILAAANLIQTVGRRGRATWAVTNAKVATALQDISGYVVAPITNSLAQDGSQNLYLGGTLAGLRIYVDPYMAWDDCRICVGRKGDGNSPGLVFMPYLLADQVSITSEGTMAPKLLVNSRFAIVEAGFYPELQYYTFGVYSPKFDII